MNRQAGYDTRECAAAHKRLPTQEQRRELIGAALEFAHLFPPGDERSQFLEIAQSLSFFAESDMCPDENPVNGHVEPSRVFTR